MDKKEIWCTNYDPKFRVLLETPFLVAFEQYKKEMGFLTSSSALFRIIEDNQHVENKTSAVRCFLMSRSFQTEKETEAARSLLNYAKELNGDLTQDKRGE